MAAIVTDSLRQYYQDLLLSEISTTSDTSQFYIGIGKGDAYDSSDTVVTPVRTLEEERELRANLQSIKKVTAEGFVIPRHNWTSGTIYSSWADNQVGVPSNTYYVLTEDNEVYICLKQGKSATGAANPSIVKPSSTDLGVSDLRPFTTSDGYTWKLMYSFNTARATSFLSSTYMPVEQVTKDSASANTFELQQLNIQNTAINGQILGVEIVDGGTGYSSAPTINFYGDGSGASATATISGGTIVKVEMDDDSASLGTGYNFATASVSAGNATIRPIIGPVDGIGRNAIKDLKSTSLMLNIRPDGDESGTFNIENDFRQISVFKNIKYTDSSVAGGIVTDASLSVNKRITTTSAYSAAGFKVDNLITGGTSGATAYIDEIIDSDTFSYHQNSNNVGGRFTSGETITSNGGGSATVDSDQNSAVNIFSGDLLYIENRARITRSASQTEDIKIVITV